MKKSRRAGRKGVLSPKPMPVKLTARQMALVQEVACLTNRSQSVVLRAAVQCLLESLRTMDDVGKMRALTEWSRTEGGNPPTSQC